MFTLTKEAIKRLRRVQTAINREPRRLNQEMWLSQVRRGNWCGTTGCTAGHLVMQEYPLATPVFDESGDAGFVVLPDGRQIAVAEEAERLLGLDDDDFEVGHELFRVSVARHTNPGTKAHARAVSENIDLWIKRYSPSPMRVLCALSLLTLGGCASHTRLSTVPCVQPVVVDVQIDYGPDCWWDLCQAPQSRAVCARGVLVYEHTVPALYVTWERAGEVQATSRELRIWRQAMKDGSGVLLKNER